MANTGKGSIIKAAINVDRNSLGEHSLDNVDFKLDFYAKAGNTSPVTGMYTVRYDHTKEVQDDHVKVDGNTIIAKCDTSGLDTGKLYATLTMTYSDDDLGEMKEIMDLSSNITIIEIPASIDPVSVEEQNGEGEQE